MDRGEPGGLQYMGRRESDTTERLSLTHSYIYYSGIHNIIMYMKHLCVFVLLCHSSSVVDAGSIRSYQLQAVLSLGTAFN